MPETKKPRYRFSRGMADKVQEAEINKLAEDGYKAVMMSTDEREALNNHTVIVLMEQERD